MPEQEYEAHLFIGGIVDGQWFTVPKTSRQLKIPVVAVGFNPPSIREIDVGDLPEAVPYTEHTYYRMRLASFMTNNISVFVSEELYTERPSYHDDSGWKIMCKLINNYKVIK